MTNDIAYSIGQIWQSPELVSDFLALCDTGGRVAGTASEAEARDLLKSRIAGLGGQVTSHSFPFEGRFATHSSVELVGHTKALDSIVLLDSPPTRCADQELEVIDIGRGTRADFEEARDQLPGRAVLVRHEFPFTTGHIHRRVKYSWAKEFGAAAFLIANNIPDTGPVSGSGGQGQDDDIPAVGLSYRSGKAIADSAALGSALVRLTIEIERRRWTPENLLVEIPGTSDEVVVVSAHYDGHALAESAMDNASGVAVALEVVRRLAPVVSGLRRGLRLALFTVEEWGLTGSERYVESLSADEHARISFNINIDTPVGHPQLSALTGGSDLVEDLVRRTSAKGGAPISLVRPVLANSDHYNFHQAGIPAVRLIAGYEDPSALSRYLLTAADNRDKVEPSQLRVAAMTTTAMVFEACRYDGRREGE